MSKSFFVVDKLNVVAKECFPLVRFNYDNSDYLIYYSASDNNCDIFISKLLRNNGKYIFDNVDSLEIFSSLVRDILELPASYTKDLNIEQLFNDFSDNHNIEFVARFPILSDQEGYNISNLMNIDMEYIKDVNYFYSHALPKLKKLA